MRNEILQSPNPTVRPLESHPCVNLASKEINSASCENCVKQHFVSYTSNLLTEMFGFRKCTEFHLMLTSSLPNQILETILICIVVLCFPLNNIARVCECTRSNASNVCHKLLSISSPHEQGCSQTIKYQVYQYVPTIDISEQFVSRLWTILPLTQFLLFLICGHPGMTSRLCTIVWCFTRQFAISFHAFFLHDLPCHRTMKRKCPRQVFLR